MSRDFDIDDGVRRRIVDDRYKRILGCLLCLHLEISATLISNLPLI